MPAHGEGFSSHNRRTKMTLQERRETLIQNGREIQQQLQQNLAQREQLVGIITQLQFTLSNVNANISLLDELLKESEEPKDKPKPEQAIKER